MRSARHGADENACPYLATERQPAATNLHEARPTGLEQQKPAAGVKSKLREAGDPTRLPGHLGHIGQITRTQTLKRDEGFYFHGTYPSH
jgi:hypothetical protein